ncbi:MAG: cyclase family protein [Oscillospiraceae bacterium]|nr:cyclase family protein [Oscillospiraceae bacterium]
MDKSIISTEEFNRLYESLKNWSKWGEDDQLGTLNYITPQLVVEATRLVKTGRCVSMAIPIDKVAGPDNAHPAIHYMSLTHDIDVDSKNQGIATDFLGMQFHGDCHTHMDSLCHISYHGKLYNGVDASLVDTSGAHTLDVTAYSSGIISRGVVIDVPRYRGVKWLEPGEAVTAEEIIAIEEFENVKLGQGDIMLFRTGQNLRRNELGPWNVGPEGEGRAGLDPYCMELLHSRKIAAFLPEGDGETIPAQVEGLRSPIHVLQITAMGLFCADSLQLDEVAEVCSELNRYECMVAIAPLRLPGGTGCPFNPIAVF